jgi:hypothetical protein
MAAPPLNHDARDVSRNTPPAKASRISARAIHVDSTDVGVRDLRIIKKQTEALYANRHAAAQKFLSTWDWPAYVKHTDLSKPEDRALGRSQGRADRQDPCPDRHRDLPGRDVSPRADFSAHEHHLGARFAQQLGAVGDRNRVRSHPRRAARRQRGGHPSGR